jgi:biotin carboxyl carrier protein
MSKLAITVDGQQFEIEVALTPECRSDCVVRINGEEVNISIPEVRGSTHIEWMIIDGRPYELAIDENLQWLRDYSGIHAIDIQDREARVVKPRSGDGRVKAPIPGLVTRILVSEGDDVRADQAIAVLEAMKMENEIRAPFDGKVRSVSVSPGETVTRNAVLIEIS